MMRFRGTYPAYDESILCVGVVNPILPDIGYTAQSIPQCVGELHISKTHGARKITAIYQLNGKSAARNMELAAALSFWAESEKAGQIVLDDAPDRFYLGILTGASNPDYAQEWPEITLTFTCANPYTYALAQQTANVGDTIFYQGSIPVWPIILFTPESDLTEAHWSDGERMLSINDAEYTLLAGHQIAVDCAIQLITDNEQSIMEYLTLTSDWPVLKRTINTINGTGGVVKWRNGYL